MKVKLEQLATKAYRKARKFLTLYCTVTPCVECYRGRLALTFAVGAGLSGNLALCGLGCIVAFVFTGRKHNWWIKND